MLSSKIKIKPTPNKYDPKPKS